MLNLINGKNKEERNFILNYIMLLRFVKINFFQPAQSYQYKNKPRISASHVSLQFCLQFSQGDLNVFLLYPSLFVLLPH